MELAFVVLPTFGRMGRVLELTFEKVHQALECVTTRSNHKETHIDAVDNSVMND